MYDTPQAVSPVPRVQAEPFLRHTRAVPDRLPGAPGNFHWGARTAHGRESRAMDEANQKKKGP